MMRCRESCQMDFYLFTLVDPYKTLETPQPTPERCPTRPLTCRPSPTSKELCHVDEAVESNTAMDLVRSGQLSIIYCIVH